MAGLATAETVGGGIGTRPARWTIMSTGFLFITGGVIEGTFGEPSLLLVTAFAASLLGGFILTTPGAHALERWRALAVNGCAILAAAALLGEVGISGEIWLFNLCAYLPALMIVRGNPLTGFAGGCAVIATGVTAGVITSAPIGAVVGLVTVPIMALLTGVLWYRLIRTLVSRDRHYREVAAQASIAATINRETALTTARELGEVRAIANPMLSVIAEGGELDHAAHHEIAVTEATIRDRLRSPGFQHPALAEAITSHRRRRGRVLILGDGAEPISGALARSLAGVVRELSAEEVTIRQLPRGQEGAVTVRIADADDAERITLADDGTILDRHS